jgi:HD superfamily phosphodiesterase
VAQVATRLGTALNRAGCSLDIYLLEAAALLHDLAKSEPDHARTGAQLLHEHGFGVVAELVSTHMDISLNEGKAISTAEVLYLADKMMQGERSILPEERFRAKMARYAGDPAILDIIAGRLKNALAIQGRIETILGRPLAEVISL